MAREESFCRLLNYQFFAPVRNMLIHAMAASLTHSTRQWQLVSHLKFASKWARNVLMQCLTSLVRDRLCALQRCFFTEENWIPIRGNNWWQDIEDLWGSFFEWIGGKVCPHWWRHICVHQKHTIQSILVPITDLNLAYWIRIVCIIKTQ